MKLMKLTALLLLTAVMSTACAEDTSQTEAVAIVNGEQISLAEFEDRLDQKTRQYEAQGIAIDEEEGMREQIEEEVLDTLIVETLILDYAAEQGIEASQEDVDAEYASLVEQAGGEESLNELLSAQGMDSNDLKELLPDQIVFQRILEQEREERGLSVTEDDIRAAYEMYKEMQPDMPPFEEVRPLLEQELEQQQQMEVFAELSEELREQADVEVLL